MHTLYLSFYTCTNISYIFVLLKISSSVPRQQCHTHVK
uniref:Uncharacterized protein n=1 Tax=Anguilla anguilla TaxID=7936 RepID=A0A0E9S812_ANGAN